MIVVGGLGSAKGAIIGTALILFIDRTFADLDQPAWRYIWIGVIMFALTLGTTRGLVGLPSQIRDFVRRRRARQATGDGEPMSTPSELEVPGL
jgi:branched-chain amino acid transport system permease protein